MAAVVIVDDSAFMISLIKTILSHENHTVIGTAKSGEEAVDLCKNISPDLVFMDILMPGMGGLSALTLIKKENPKTKVIMVTAFGQESKIQAAKQLGASGYIRKPFKEQEIISAVKLALSFSTESQAS